MTPLRRPSWGARAQASPVGPLAGGAVALLVAFLPAALLTVALLGRTSLDGLSTRWAGTLLLGVGALLGWTASSGGVRSPTLAVAALLPAAGLAGLILSRLYGSDDVYHAFVHGAWWKGPVLAANAALILAVPVIAGAVEAAAGGAAGARLPAALAGGRAVLRRRAGAVVGATLGGAGLLQAVSFSAVATDDLIRYWAVVDAWTSGVGYPVSTGAAGASQFYLVELPLYPSLIALSFSLLGHRYLAMQLPLVLANLLLPFLFYATARAAGAGRWWAAWLSLALLGLPFYQVYALGAPEPEPLLAAALCAVMWLTLRLTAPGVDGAPAAQGWGRDGRRWAALGLVAGAAVLVRPEGIIYVGALFLALALTCTWRRPAWLIAAAVCAVPVGLFSLFMLTRFGVLWPAGWANVAGPRFLADNWRLVLVQDLPHYAAVLGLPAPALTGPILGAIAVVLVAAGLLRLWRTHPVTRCIPLAVGLNLGVVLLSPTYLSADLFSPPTFFRHVSVAFPWLIPALAVLLPGEPGDPVERRARRGRGTAGPSLARSAVAGIAVVVLVAELAVLVAATGRPPFGPPGVLTSDPYVLLADLWSADDRLPLLPFVPGPGGPPVVDPGFDYLAFRSRLFDAVRPGDLHVDDAGRAYLAAAGLIALTGLGALGLVSPGAAPAGRGRPVDDPEPDGGGAR